MPKAAKTKKVQLNKNHVKNRKINSLPREGSRLRRKLLMLPRVKELRLAHYSTTEIAAIVSEEFKMKVSQPTILSWLKE